MDSKVTRENYPVSIRKQDTAPKNVYKPPFQQGVKHSFV